VLTVQCQTVPPEALCPCCARGKPRGRISGSVVQFAADLLWHALYARRTGDNKFACVGAANPELSPKKRPVRKALSNAFGSGRNTGQSVLGRGRWCGGECKFGYLGFDMSWTGYWMLKWREAGLPVATRYLRAALVGSPHPLVT